MQINDLLKSYKSSFEEKFSTLVSGLASAELEEAVRYSILDGGKRLRPILSLLTAEAVLAKPEQISLDENPASALAMAIELVHCGSLIHDDLPCMDDDDLRRGKATNHIKFGEARALLAGDFLLIYPIEVLLGMSGERNAVMGAFATSLVALKLSQAIKDMILGQAMDMDSESITRDTDSFKRKSYLNKLQELKTGALIQISVEGAAILAGATEAQVSALKTYAMNIGKAFQIVDDILDCSSSSEVLGKSVGKDLTQNKLTFVSEYGIDGAKAKAKDLISSALEKLDQAQIYADKLKMLANYVLSRTH